MSSVSVCMEERVPVVVAVANPFLRDLIYWALSVESYKVETSVCGITALSLIKDSQPDLAILDATLPGMGGILLIQHLRKVGVATKCVMYIQDQYTAFAPYIISRKMSGVLCQQCGLFEMMHCMDEVRQGRFYCTPHFYNYLKNNDQSALHIHAPIYKMLTRQERKVACLIAEGCSIDRIAEQLHISYRTVVNHKRNMVDKLQLSGTHELLPFVLSVRHLLQ